MAIVCVGTPTGPDGTPDLGDLLHVANEVAALTAQRSSDFTVVLRSTVPSGTMENVIAPSFDIAENLGVRLAYHPESLREGSSFSDSLETPMVVMSATSHIEKLDLTSFAAELYPSLEIQFFGTEHPIRIRISMSLKDRFDFIGFISSLEQIVDQERE